MVVRPRPTSDKHHMKTITNSFKRIIFGLVKCTVACIFQDNNMFCATPTHYVFIVLPPNYKTPSAVPRVKGEGRGGEGRGGEGRGGEGRGGEGRGGEGRGGEGRGGEGRGGEGRGGEGRGGEGRGGEGRGGEGRGGEGRGGEGRGGEGRGGEGRGGEGRGGEGRGGEGRGLWSVVQLYCILFLSTSVAMGF